MSLVNDTIVIFHIVISLSITTMTDICLDFLWLIFMIRCVFIRITLFMWFFFSILNKDYEQMVKCVYK